MNKKNNLLLLLKNQFTQINLKPIIVLGNQKSGTTVIAKLIGIASDKTVNYDIFFRAHLTDFEYQKTIILKKMGFNINTTSNNYLNLLYNNFISLNQFVHLKKNYFSSDIIKDPDFTFFYDELVTIFPEAKFLFIVRNPFDNIRSILNRLDLAGHLEQNTKEYQDKLKFIKNKLPAWGDILEGKNPEVWGDNYVKNLALRWNLAADTYLNNSDNIILIRYEDFIKNKVACINNLCDNLGLQVVNDISSEVDKQYQPKGKSKINLYTFFGEINYQIIEDSCKAKMLEFGYFSDFCEKYESIYK